MQGCGEGRKAEAEGEHIHVRSRRENRYKEWRMEKEGHLTVDRKDYYLDLKEVG